MSGIYVGGDKSKSKSSWHEKNKFQHLKGKKNNKEGCGKKIDVNPTPEWTFKTKISFKDKDNNLPRWIIGKNIFVYFQNFQLLKVFGVMKHLL